MRFGQHWKKSIWKDIRAISPAISMAIITAATIVMVLVSSTYAYSALQRQQAAAEFDAMQKSFQTFDDTIRDVAWNRASARTTHFTADYGFIEYVGPFDLSITANVGDQNIDFTPDIQTSLLRYNLSTRYLTFGNNYKNYVIGDARAILNEPNQPVGQLVVTQQNAWININLAYRVRVMIENSNDCTYVDVLVTKLYCDASGTNAGDFDLFARNTQVTTKTYPQAPITLSSAASYTLVATLKDSQGYAVNFPFLTNPDTVNGDLAEGKVVFNFIVTTVQVDV